MKKFLESRKMKLLVMSCLVLSMMLCTVCAAEGDGSSSAAMSTVTTAFQTGFQQIATDALGIIAIIVPTALGVTGVIFIAKKAWSWFKSMSASWTGLFFSRRPTQWQRRFRSMGFRSACRRSRTVRCWKIQNTKGWWNSMAKTNQKCVRLSDRVTKYIEQYRGANFSEKLENLVLDMEERRDELVQDWNQLQAQISDKHHEMVMIQDRVKKLREADRRLGPLVESLLDLMRLP